MEDRGDGGRPVNTLRGAIAALLVLTASFVVPAAASGGTLKCSDLSTDPADLASNARPVVLVHGYNGEPLHETAEDLGRLLGADWQTFAFDYAEHAGEWAASDQVAGCLADYITALSARSADNGGPGTAYLVGHSMGGLAARFAAARMTHDGESIEGMIAGVVTLGTPHTGSPWGDTPYAAIVEALEGRLPNPFGGTERGSNRMASHCLALHDGGRNMRPGCAAPPYLDSSIPLMQVAAAVTVRRTLFGFDLYDINLGGDSVVPIGSAGGYIGSADGRLPTGTPVAITNLNCTTTSERIYGFAATAGVNLFQRGFGRVISVLDNDTAAMDAILGGRADPALLQFLVLANLVADCAHNPLTTNSAALAATAQALEGFPGKTLSEVSEPLGGSDLTSQGLCSVPCQVTGRVPVNHPTWR